MARDSLNISDGDLRYQSEFVRGFENKQCEHSSKEPESVCDSFSLRLQPLE